MYQKKILLLTITIVLFLKVVAQQDPERLYGELFIQVQLQKVFEDSKTFPDCIPLFSAQKIKEDYILEKNQPNFDLRKFVLSHFMLPESYDQEFITDTSLCVTDHVEKLWTILTRQPDTTSHSSLIPLPHPYIVPGGRFREIYYWDSYFTLLGLQCSKKDTLIKNMVDNFSFLIEKYGFIPNGNRTYYLSRSQPPFYSLMVCLLAEQQGKEVLVKYLPYLEKEYNFWMSGKDSLKNMSSYRRVVRLKKNKVLNRYWDDRPIPRPESYKEDVALSASTSRNPEQLYRDLRAACESGWDFSSRWLKNADSLQTIHTTEIIPIDLNCILLHLEKTISEAYRICENNSKRKYYSRLYQQRKSLIQKYFWNKNLKFYSDYDFVSKTNTSVKSLAAAYPLFFNISNKKRARITKETINREFNKKGGLITTLNTTHQQWDAPNGWAPLQWIVIKGFMNYGFKNEAAVIKEKWLHLNTKVYKNTGKMLEKYNVENTTLKGGGGEYPLQDGFGWTNGVYLKLTESSF